MNDRLNICQLNDSFPPVIDGVSNVVLNYSRIIQEKYGNVVVVVPRYPGEHDDYPFKVVRYPSVVTPITSDYRMGLPVPGIARDIRKHTVDIIHCHCPFVSSVIAKPLRQMTGAPVIFTYHTKYDIDIANSFDSELVQTVAKKLVVTNIEWCDEIWAVSRGAGENLRSMGYQGEYRVMENGVDFPKGPAAPGQCEMIGEEHSLPPDLPVFLYIGRMMWYKGIRLILDGLQAAKASGARFKMIFVGGGADFDPITRLAHSHGLDSDCIFTGPIRDREKLRAYFSRADLFLFPSTFDTSGIAVREAAACGLASVLIRGSSAAEPVTDGRNAVLIGEDSNNLAWAVINLLKNREKMKALGRQAMDDLYLSWDTAVANAFERYEQIFESRKETVIKKTIKKQRAAKAVNGRA